MVMSSRIKKLLRLRGSISHGANRFPLAAARLAAPSRPGGSSQSTTSGTTHHGITAGRSRGLPARARSHRRQIHRYGHRNVARAGGELPLRAALRRRTRPVAALAGAVLSVGRAARGGLVRRAQRGAERRWSWCAATTAAFAHFATRAGIAVCVSPKAAAAPKPSSAATTAGLTGSTDACTTFRTIRVFRTSTKRDHGLVPVHGRREMRARLRDADSGRRVGRRARRSARSDFERPAHLRRERKRLRRELEAVHGGESRGISHQAHAQDDVLSLRLRQPDADRDVRPQQPRDVPVPAHREAPSACRRNSATSRVTSRTCITCSRT